MPTSYDSMLGFWVKTGQSAYDKDWALYVAVSESGQLKIGISSNPYNRVKGLRSPGRKERVEIARLIKLDCYERARYYEEYLMRLYADRKVKGEWYDVSLLELDVALGKLDDRIVKRSYEIVPPQDLHKIDGK